MAGAGVGPERVAERLRESKSCVIITHRNADPDAVAASMILWAACRAMGSQACIALPEGVSRPSKRVLEALGLSLPLCSGAEEAELVVVVDASNKPQLGAEAGRLGGSKVVVVDHHEPGDIMSEADESYVVVGAASSTQLALDVARAAGTPLPFEVLSLALAGILYDTRRFSNADPPALRWASILLELGAEYARMVEALQSSRQEGLPDFSERWAKLRAAQRLRIAKFCGEYIAAVTHIGSFESSVARALIELGADVAAVATQRKDEVRVSVRVSRRALEAGVKASELASYIASKFGGRGGGHEAAGMAHIPLREAGQLDVEELVEEIARSLPGKAARLCVESRGARGGRGEAS